MAKLGRGKLVSEESAEEAGDSDDFKEELDHQSSLSKKPRTASAPRLDLESVLDKHVLNIAYKHRTHQLTGQLDRNFVESAVRRASKRINVAAGVHLVQGIARADLNLPWQVTSKENDKAYQKTGALLAKCKLEAAG